MTRDCNPGITNPWITVEFSNAVIPGLAAYMFKMSTTGRGACIQTFAKVVNLLIVVCCKSSQICCGALFSSGMVLDFE